MLKLDARDLAILRALSREGRMPKTALARHAGLSDTACWERLRRLERAGVIAGYRAEVALRRLAPHVTVFVTVELGAHRPEVFDAFERMVSRREEIVGAWALGGGIDYLLEVVTRDVESYQALMDALLAERAGVARYFTYVVTKPVKRGPPPFEALLGLAPED